VSRARDVVEVVARALTLEPDQVAVRETTDRDGSLVELHTAPGDLGRIIGRQGRTANAIRTIAMAASERDGVEVTIEFRDGPPEQD